MSSKTYIPLLMAAGCMTLAAASPAARHALAPGHAAAAAPVVTITARDFAFDAPATIPAGAVTLRLVNRGAELHHVQLVRLAAGKHADDYLAALHAGGPPPAWATEAGGPNAPVPGAETRATLLLQPGRYALVCFIPSKDGMPHVMKGMSREITVVPSATSPRALAPADLSVRLVDYAFGWSRPPTAGRHVVRFRNDAMQPHEAVIVRMLPGKKTEDFMAWVEKQDGPPPAVTLGGITGLGHGQQANVPIDFTPGSYALVCFIPDAHDGRPHAAHGMFQSFTVR